MAIITVPDGNEISLPEFRVGKAGQTCLCPGIMQCFSVVGWRTSGLVGMHVSPGFTQQDMTDAFAVLREKGGNWVSDWYITGPFNEHFAVTRAVWRSANDIAQTFDTEFPGSTANRWILDCTAQRNEKTWDSQVRQFCTKRGLDIRNVHKPGLGEVEISHTEYNNPASVRCFFEKSEFSRL